MGSDPADYNKDCSYYFEKLDIEILRPLLIYKYQREKMERQDEFVELMLSNVMGSIYDKIEDEVLFSQKENAI